MRRGLEAAGEDDLLQQQACGSAVLSASPKLIWLLSMHPLTAAHVLQADFLKERASPAAAVQQRPVSGPDPSANSQPDAQAMASQRLEAAGDQLPAHTELTLPSGKHVARVHTAQAWRTSLTLSARSPSARWRGARQQLRPPERLQNSRSLKPRTAA